ncbi:hypothetical protein HN681_03625 [archaeon]|jgi:hypothetical protein|nr:hypothetical protein [archaeon]MBT3730397.1 hypothetical protein [archaeon]MBT4670380.1 hypothetical protein [archaeon]MBT5030155.1 hypothetical protein [archaeon]MBT5287726.1 hypothetical protein [archaeon]
MKDIYNTTILCDKCSSKTIKGHVTKNGFDIRLWHCPKCKKQWYHPLDIEAYKEYIELKKKDYKVKLRPVGNSWVISIPKEIINFQQDQTETKIVSLSMDEPGKLSLKFKRVRKFIKQK